MQYSRSRGTSNAEVMWPSSSSITAPPQSMQLLFRSMAGCVTWKSFPSRPCDSHSMWLFKHTGASTVGQQDWKRKEIEKQWPFMLVKSANRWQDLHEGILAGDGQLAWPHILLTYTETCESAQLEETGTLWWQHPQHWHMDVNTHGWSTKLHSLLSGSSEVG